jgi:hypothetical protein
MLFMVDIASLNELKSTKYAACLLSTYLAHFLVPKHRERLMAKSCKCVCFPNILNPLMDINDTQQEYYTTRDHPTLFRLNSLLRNLSICQPCELEDGTIGTFLNFRSWNSCCCIFKSVCDDDFVVKKKHGVSTEHKSTFQFYGGDYINH